ncbi:hypothetical protein HYPP_03819 [Hyphomicrobium sp. ghe19]|nr:hypothetical protein HYPP_03819 [Hyphomicrobium sp. ghe19]
MLAQLTFEAEVDVVRHALGIPTDIEAAQRLSKEDAETLPEPKRTREPRDETVGSASKKTDKTKH